MRFFKISILIIALIISYLFLFKMEVICHFIDNKPGCYKENILLRLKFLGIDNSRDYLKSLADRDLVTRGQCHVLGHELGRVAAQKNISMTESMSESNSFCSWAVFHGVMEGLFGAEAGHGAISEDEAYVICREIPRDNRIEFFNCFHALGHGFHAIDVNIESALKRCDRGDDKLEKDFCYDGVFMAHAMLLGELDEIDRGVLSRECLNLNSSYHPYCYWRSVAIEPFYITDVEFKEVLEIAEKEIPAQFLGLFWDGLGRELDSYKASDFEEIKYACQFAGEYQVECIKGAARHMILYDKGDNKRALELCQMLDSGSSECTAGMRVDEYPGLSDYGF